MQDSTVYHMCDTYIVESNISPSSYTIPETPQILIYDGSVWRPVTLSDSIKEQGFPWCFPLAMSSEYVFFVGTYATSMQEQDGAITLYRISLTDPNYALTPCGTFLS